MPDKPLVPHLELPFRFANYGSGMQAAVTEQDTHQEIANCVVAVVRTYVGFRLEEPDFGIPDYLFQQDQIDLDELRNIIRRWEPRAETYMERIISDLDPYLQNVRIGVGGSAITGLRREGI